MRPLFSLPTSTRPRRLLPRLAAFFLTLLFPVSTATAQFIFPDAPFAAQRNTLSVPSLQAGLHNDVRASDFLFHTSRTAFTGGSPSDSLLRSGDLSATPDSLVKKPERYAPWQVALLATAPGAGQVYNQSYWKLPIVYGVFGFLIYNFARNNSEYVRYRDLYRQDQTSITAASNRSLRDQFRNARDEIGAYLLITYLATIVDAYIDASLFDFDVSDNLTLRTLPPGVPQSKAIFSVRLKF